MAQTTYFVDTENVGCRWSSLLSECKQTDKFVLIYTKKSPPLPMELFAQITYARRKVECVVSDQGSNIPNICIEDFDRDYGTNYSGEYTAETYFPIQTRDEQSGDDGSAGAPATADGKRCLWVCVGATMHINSSEESAILRGDDAAVREAFARIFEERRYELDGETFIPDTSVADFNWLYGTKYPECEICANF